MNPSLLNSLKNLVARIDIFRHPRSILQRSLWVVSACGLTSLFAWPVRDYLDPANTAMLYLLAVALVAMRAGRYAAIIAAFLSTALLDFFFIQPRFSFSVADVQYVVTLAVMLVIALIIGNLTTILQRQAAVAIERERQSQALYQLASQLAGAASLEQVASATRHFLQQMHNCRSVLLMKKGQQLLPAEPDHALTSSVQTIIALGVLTQAKILTLPDDEGDWLFLPLPGSTYIRGVLAINFSPASTDTDSVQQPLFEAIASLIAIAVERLHFVEVAQRTHLQMTNERLRSAILSALSHDIRTPLTVLYGMADTLSFAQLPQSVSDTVTAMREQALRLNNMVSNLLDMAKLRAGNVQLNQEWQPLEEVIGASIKVLGTALEQHPVKVNLPPDLPLLKFDALLMERVFCNLLENAAKYSPPASIITLSARVEGEHVHIAVQDSGSGFPPDKLDNVFDLFDRGNAESTIPGVGLGLAICRSIIQAHDGEIIAENREGACVTFTLSLGNPPVIELENDE
jgi:two-component system sensor histidine kinase KdpD